MSYYDYNMPDSTQIADFRVSNFTNSGFTRVFVKDGKIFSESNQGTNQIGVTLEVYQDLELTTTEYYNKLVELGVIEIPLTQEQINEKLMAELNSVKEERTKLASILETIANKLDMNEVKHGSEKYDNGSNGSNTGDVTNDTNSTVGTGESE